MKITKPKSRPKKKESNLKRFVNSQLSLTARAHFKDDIMKKCSVNESTYYKRLKKPKLFSQLERDYIAKLLDQPASDLFK